jgi:hypothetical protein
MPIPKSHFIECKYDGNFDDQFTSVEKNSENLFEQTKVFLRSFFKLFFSNGRLQPQTLDKQHTGTGVYFGETDHPIPWQTDHLNCWRTDAANAVEAFTKIVI